MADYRDHQIEIESSGAGLAALSVDEPLRTEALRRQLGLSYPILCDTAREVVKAWGLYNPLKAGGIARPALLVIDRDLRVLYRSSDRTITRLTAADLTRFLRARKDGGGAGQLRRRLVLPSWADGARSLANVVRLGYRSPRPSNSSPQRKS